jgi:hypothetical protein
MSDRLLACTVVATLAALAVPSLGCNPVSADKEQAMIADATRPSVTSISPHDGLAGVATLVTITGTKFQAGVAVSIDGNAVVVRVLNETSIVATTPVHPSGGVVDVVVTNPTGQSATLTGGFYYGLVTLTVGPSSSVAPFGTLSVSWVAPGRTPPGIYGDWIGLFRVGDDDRASVWSLPTTGVSGTFTLTAPGQPGEYEFRYLVDDDYVDVAHSSLVTVSASGTRLR